ncbi:MAG: hypothetical protein U0529_08310 [Thermoanaerobaculia bacterium]
MRERFPVGAIAASLLLLSGVAVAEKASPTPAPTTKPARKLGGGNFGLPPAPTPTGGAADSTLAGAARKTQVEAPAAGGRPSRSIVITNESLGKGEPAPAGTSVTITGKPGGKPTVKGPPTPKPQPTPQPIPEYRDASGRTEADWRARASHARERIDRAAADLAAAQAEVRRLENDFYAWSDGNYRERVIRPAWDQAKEHLKDVETEAENAKTAMSDLEEEARKSGTPPGWLR